MNSKRLTKLFTTKEVAQKCGLSYQSVARWVNRSRIHFPWKEDQKVSLEDFIDFINNNNLPNVFSKNISPPSVLIVDDEENIANSIGRVFQSNGFDTLLASNGFKAALLFKQEVPQVITVDLNMENLDGYDVLSIIKNIRTTKKAWIIIISGNTEDSCKKAVEMGADFYLTKPFSKTDLETIIRRIYPKPN